MKNEEFGSVQLRLKDNLSNYNMKSIIIICGCLLGFIISVSAQEHRTDSIVSEGDYGMVRTNINITYDCTWGGLSDGFSARVSYQCFKNKIFTLTANGRYHSVTADFDADDLPSGFSPEAMGLNGTHIMGQLGLSATARTTLWGKTMLAFGSVNMDLGEGGYARTSALLMGIVLLRQTKNTQFGIGPLVMVNTNSKVPAFLVFMCLHRFNERWLINLYGGMFGIDYTPTRNDLIAIGGDIDVKSFYFRPHTEGLPERCQYRKTSFRSMLKYRRRLKPHLYLEVEGGVSLRMSSRVTGVTGTTEYFDINLPAAPFVQAGVSYAL